MRVETGECPGCLSVSHCDGSAVTLILSNSGQDTTGLETRPSTTSWSKQGKQRGAAELDVGWWSSCWIVHTHITKLFQTFLFFITKFI